VIRAVCLVLALAVTGCAVPGPTPNDSPEPQATPARPPPPSKIADLIGGGPEQVLAVFGPPVLRRRDGMAEVWLYAAGPDCKVDLVFYRDGDQLKLSLAQTRGEPKSESDCLRQMVTLPAK